jgi:DNA mismatch repair ATPase MutS
VLQAAFTFTTTHHAELKDEATSNPEFASAAVQFDVTTLKPTYKLVWGELGASNALAVAQTLGFDRTVVADGHVWKAKLSKLQRTQENGGQISAALEVNACAKISSSALRRK